MLARIWLRLKGYSILDTRFKSVAGEIDIIACRRHVLAFVEVKYRQQQSAAKIAVTPGSWQRIARTADLWAARHPETRRLDWRFDLITISPRNWPKHHSDYWRP